MTMTRARKQKSIFLGFWKNPTHLFFITLFILTGILYATPFSLLQFPIQEVKVIGANHINHQQMQQLLRPFVSKGFFGVEVEEIKEKILQISWVSHVSVRRIWPNQVWINIAEKKPVARWNKDSLLTSVGDLFIPREGEPSDDLPQFIGPDGKQIYILEYYNRINNLLSPLHFKIARLEFTPSHIWNITLNNGMKLTLDHKDFLTRFRHFVKVYPRIIGNRAAEIEYIDLRYSNGVAVRWKTVT